MPPLALLLGLSRDDAGEWFGDHGAAIIGTVAVAVLLGWAVRRVVPGALRPAIQRQLAERPQVEVERRVETLSSVIVRTAQFAVLVLAFITIMPELGINIGPVLAGVGITGLALSLGAQSLVRDGINGIFILSENQYARGDVVTIAGVTGTVQDISLRRTMLRDIDGVLYSVPNGTVVVVANHTREQSRVRVLLPLAHGTDLSKARQVIDRVGEELARDPDLDDRILTPPRFLRVESVDMNGMTVQVNGVVVPGTQWEIAGILRGRLIDALRAEGIRTPWG